jgi:hypothetical protein
MELDRYSTGIPRFRVFRHVEETTNPLNVLRDLPPGREVVRDLDGRLWAEVDPWECFVLKRRDMFTKYALSGYVSGATLHQAYQTGMQVIQLLSDWQKLTSERNDEKLPD